jgi:peptide/nickel transport system ATP-binding protein
VKLDVRGLTVRYGTGSDRFAAVDGVSFGFPEGGTLGLVGESGCGKSSIAKALVGLVPSEGQVFVDGKDFSSKRARGGTEFRRKVQMIFQDPYSSLNPRMTVQQLLIEVMPRGGTRADRRKEALRVLDLVGMSQGALARYPHQFSGGQRQRIAIARALATRPEIIVNDEVTSALDVSVQATILNLLKDLQKELKLSYVFISHDLASVRYMSDRVSVMYLGRIVETAETNQLFDHPGHPYTQTLIDSIPKFGEQRRPSPIVGDPADPRNLPSGCRFHTRCPVGPRFRADRSMCTEIDPYSTITPGGVACHFPEGASAVFENHSADPVPVVPD